MIDLAKSISFHHQEILRLWVEVADRAQSARGLSHPAFLNMIGVYLSALSSDPDSDSERQLLLEQHLSTRLRQGFELAEILGELSLLGHCVAQAWSNAAPQDRPGPEQTHQFYARLQRDAALVSSVFRHHMLEDEQREKRFRRLIRQVAEHSLAPCAQPLAERYGEILHLVMQSTQAQSASLLLPGLEGSPLHLAASVGLGSQEMEGDLIGTLSANSDELLSDSVREIEPRRALRQAGIFSLLSSPLAPHSPRPVGVLIIGSDEERTFSPRERRHLEALAEQVSFHLESARLFANLTATIDDLRRERELRELFVAVLAHDLRGPLAASKLAAYLMASPEELNAGELDKLRLTLSRNIDGMDRLIQDLLDVSRVKAGQSLPLQLAACDLGELAAEVVEELRPVCPARYDLHCQARVIGVWSQESLRRAMWNLISNAAKYGRPGAPITVTVEGRPSGGRFAVHNEGAAISPADQAKSVCPFFQDQGSSAERQARLGPGAGPGPRLRGRSRWGGRRVQPGGYGHDLLFRVTLRCQDPSRSSG